MGVSSKTDVAEEPWKLILSSEADSGLEDILEKYGDDAYSEALNDLLALEEDPIPEHAQHLRRTQDHYRIYIYRSLYRAIYRVLSGKRIVVVERVGPRSSVYRGFDRR